MYIDEDMNTYIYLLPVSWIRKKCPLQHFVFMDANISKLYAFLLPKLLHTFRGGGWRLKAGLNA